jgi:subtilase family serine protease
MRRCKLLLLLVAPSLCFAAQQDRITGTIDASQKVVLSGSVHPLATAEYDQGAIESTLPFPWVTLVMAPSASQQAALNQLLAEQQERASPNYHKWLTPEQYADRFGVSQNDVTKISLWLQSQGFSVVTVARGRNSLAFSGTAAQIESAFSTQIHRYNVNGENHIANATPVEIPAALSGVVTGIRGLTNFRLRPMYVRPAPGTLGASGLHPHYTGTIDGQPDYFLAPGDIATIYDINPLYSATPTAINGTGQQLAIIGQTDVYLADINYFRSGFGLSSIPTTGAGACTTNSSGIVVEPCVTTNFEYILVGTDYGVSPFGDIIEADLDLEWSGATAQNAQIIFVNAPVNSTETSGGVGVSLAYAIDNVVAPVITMSYGLCESESSPFFETELQQANTEGITFMNSAGDTGSFACDNDPPNNESNPPFEAAVDGIGVNYPASSPEATGVGGTSIPLSDLTSPSSFWSSSNASNGGSALPSLIGQEISWNDDVAFASACRSEPTNSFCENGGPPAVTGWVPLTTTATAQQVQEDIWISEGSGGVSNCYTQNASGICAANGGFPRPTWQTSISISGVPSERLVPDVSLLASPNFPGYIICTPMNALTGSGTDTTSSCASGIATAVDTNFSLVGGTSAASPIFAGIITLINQYLGSAGLGNINSTLYSLAAANSTNQAFHPITSGDNDVYCQPGTPTGQPSGVICPSSGVFGFSDSQSSTASPTIYNPVNGLGSVDANKLAIAWAASRTGTPTITLSANATSVFQGQSVSFTANVTPTTSIGAVSFTNVNNSVTTTLGTSMLNTPYSNSNPTTGTTVFSTETLPAGTNSITATYEGDASSNGSAASAPAAVNVLVPFTISAAPSALSLSAGQTGTVTVTLTPQNGFTGAVSLSCSSGLPTGATCTFANGGSVSLNGSTASTIQLTVGTLPDMASSSATSITIAGTTGGAVIPTTFSLAVTPTTEKFSLSSTASTFPVVVGGTASVQVTVNSSTGFINTSNSTTVVPLTYTCSGIPASAEIACQPQGNGQPTNATTVTISLVTTSVTSKLKPDPLGRSRIFYAVLLPGVFGIMFLRPRLRHLRMLSLIMVLGISTLWLGSCGGSKSSNTGPSSLQNGGTPPGNYSVTINATTGGAVPLTNTLSVTLSVAAQ